MGCHKDTEWTVIESYEDDDFVCIDFYETKKEDSTRSQPPIIKRNSISQPPILKSNPINDFESYGIKTKSYSDKIRNRLSSLKEEDRYSDWDKYISTYRKSIYCDEIEILQNRLKELKIIEKDIERNLDRNKRNQKNFKEAQNKYVENQEKIKGIDKNVNKLLQDVYKLNQLRDIGKDLLDNKICFGLSNVDFKILQKIPAEFVAFPAFIVEFNQRKDSVPSTKCNDNLRYLDSLPQGITDDIIKSANKYDIKYTTGVFNEYEKTLC